MTAVGIVLLVGWIGGVCAVRRLFHRDDDLRRGMPEGPTDPSFVPGFVALPPPWPLLYQPATVVPRPVARSLADDHTAAYPIVGVRGD